MRKRPPRKLRIIGGRWRRHHINFPEVLGLRPTQDRIRETLFNWLAPMIQDASCLDLFAGSGALGFEALSRGAKRVSFVDSNQKVLDAIKHNAERLAQIAGLESASVFEIVFGKCPDKLPSLNFVPYDIVFLDPPFHAHLLLAAMHWLDASGYCNKKTYIYVETAKDNEPFPLLPNWSVLKSDKTKNLAYYLLLRESN